MSEALARPLTVEETLQVLEREVGGRSEIIAALATAPQTKDVRYILGLLADPDNQKLGLAAICQLAKIVPGTLLDYIERGTKLRTRIIAGSIVAQGTPAMVRDVMQKAAPYEDICTDCQGVGSKTPDPTPDLPNPTPQPCPTCRGGGKLRYDADADCRKLGLEMAGLTAKGGGIVINNQQVALATGAGGFSFEAYQEALDRVLYGTAPVVQQTEIVDADLTDSPAGDVP